MMKYSLYYNEKLLNGTVKNHAISLGVQFSQIGGACTSRFILGKLRKWDPSKISHHNYGNILL